ncbi:MAG: MFS transporter [Chloroflexi bacterium]|nr:MFS transporter [Chloroflexota bacterium]MDA1145103.1 MFS transporter [Chloroflexota bacterium]
MTIIGRAFRPLREHEQLLMITISTVLVMAGQGVVSPILPAFAKSFGVSTFVIGLTLTSFALARMVLNVPLGLLSDRRGRRVLLVGGPIVTAVGMFGSGFAPDIWQLLAWRFVAGAGSAMYMTGAQIYLVDVSTAQTRAMFLGTNQMAISLGVALGPGIGGIVAEFMGLRAPFHVVGASALLAGAYAYWRLPETRHLAYREPALADGAVAATPSGGPPWLRMMRSRRFLAVALVSMMIFFTRGASRQTLIPLIAIDELGFSTGALGGFLMATSLMLMVLLPLAAFIADRFGRTAAILPGGIVVGLALLGVAASHSVPPFVVSGLALSVGFAIAGPAPAAYAAEIAPPEMRGLAMGLYRTAGDFGLLIGAPLLGLIADARGFGWALVTNAVLMVAAVGFFAFAAGAGRAAPSTEAEVARGTSG